MKTAILFILMMLVLVIPHEWGHLIVAKLCGVKVNEFSVGMGPLLFKRQRGETQYSVRLLPLGGYCAMEGEEEAVDDPTPDLTAARHRCSRSRYSLQELR